MPKEAVKPIGDSAEKAEAAKQAIFSYGRRKGALAIGVADVDALDRIAPEGFSPREIMPRVRSVISVGVGGPKNSSGVRGAGVVTTATGNDSGSGWVRSATSRDVSIHARRRSSADRRSLIARS